MPFYAGFDLKNYPGIDMMNWLKSNTNLTWCGYYLAPAPNRPPSGWNGQYSDIKDQWGVAPIYVGQQDPKTGNNNCTLTSDQGQIDGNNAADLVSGDQFPQGTYVYLDWEQGDINADGSVDYIAAWISAVIADGRAMPGIYCSYAAAPLIVQKAIDTLNPTPNVRVWCWQVDSAAPHTFEGDLSSIPTVDPTGCGFAGASSWQREQNAIVTFPDGAPTSSLQMDFNTSSLANLTAPDVTV